MSNEQDANIRADVAEGVNEALQHNNELEVVNPLNTSIDSNSLFSGAEVLAEMDHNTSFNSAISTLRFKGAPTLFPDTINSLLQQLYEHMRSLHYVDAQEFRGFLSDNLIPAASAAHIDLVLKGYNQSTTKHYPELVRKTLEIAINTKDISALQMLHKFIVDMHYNISHENYTIKAALERLKAWEGSTGNDNLAEAQAAESDDADEVRDSIDEIFQTQKHINAVKAALGICDTANFADIMFPDDC